MSEVTSVDDALASFREMLAADGYELTWAESAPARVVVSVAAGEGACEDCLVPLPVMTAIMTKALGPTAYELERVDLPAGAAH